MVTREEGRPVGGVTLVSNGREGELRCSDVVPKTADADLLGGVVTLDSPSEEEDIVLFAFSVVKMLCFPFLLLPLSVIAVHPTEA